MAITDEQITIVKDVLDLAEKKKNKMTGWDIGFVFGDDISKEKGFKSIKEKWDEYGPRMHLTEKQDQLLRKMHDKLVKA